MKPAPVPVPIHSEFSSVSTILKSSFSFGGPTIADRIYEFGFVPNGDSPKKLSIKLMGKTISFHEDFELQGTLVEDEISSWYTWEYLGEKNISFGESQKVKIIIDPNGSLKGPVSVQLIPMK